MSQERRRHPRFELVAQAEIATSQVLHLLRVANASRGGLFLRATPENYPDFKPGVEVKLQVFPGSDDDAGEVRAVGRIVRIDPGGEGGFAVEFVEVEDPQVLEHLLEAGASSARF
jgi:hypothetical protein